MPRYLKREPITRARAPDQSWRHQVRRFRNPRAVQKWVQTGTWTVTLLGIAGFSLMDFLSPMAVWVLAVAGVAVGATVTWLLPDSPDEYTTEPEVDWAWEEMLRRAEESVEVIAGDLSWVDSKPELTRELLHFRQRSGSVQLICKPPKPGTDLWRRVTMMLEAGIDVRVLPERYRPLPFNGLVVDRARLNQASGLRTQTREGQGPLGGRKDKWARRYLPTRDAQEMAVWLSLTKTYWDLSLPVALFQSLRGPSRVVDDFILTALRLVPLYTNIALDDVQFRTVEVGTLYSWVLRRDKELALEPLMLQMRDQGRHDLDPCYCWTRARRSVWLPPIVEEHDDKVVVMEGTHRLSHFFREDQTSRATVLQVRCVTPLPGVPVPFTKLPVVHHKLGLEGRKSLIAAYRHECWRSFGAMNHFLENISDEGLRGHGGSIRDGVLGPLP